MKQHRREWLAASPALGCDLGRGGLEARGVRCGPRERARPGAGGSGAAAVGQRSHVLVWDPRQLADRRGEPKAADAGGGAGPGGRGPPRTVPGQPLPDGRRAAPLAAPGLLLAR